MAVFDVLNQPGPLSYSLASATGATNQGVSRIGAGNFLSAAQRMQRIAEAPAIAAQTGQQIGLGGLLYGDTYKQQELDLATSKFKQQDARRQQLLNLLGLTPQTVGQGGLLGNTFFQSVLGNTLPDVVGGVTGAIPGLGGALGGGGAGAGSAPGGAAPTSLFGQQIAGRGQLGQQIMGLLGGFGESERGRIAQAQKDLLNTNLARLESRGLGGSNLATNAAEQAARFGSEQNLALSDRLIGQQVGALQQFGEGLFGDVGKELDRQTTTRGQTMSLLSNLLGSALKL